ncbi:MAG: hypothetical protein WBB73_11860 [Candidatus Aminicenantaceae bacterium]
MSRPKKRTRFKRRLLRCVLVMAYFPLSLSVIGLLAYHMRCPSPLVGRYPFPDVFLFYAHPLNLKYLAVHSVSLLFSFLFLVLLASAAETARTVLTRMQLRIVLMTLIIVFTILTDIFFNTLIGLSSLSINARRDILIPLFLYVDVHLILLFLYTFLPAFRRGIPIRTDLSMRSSQLQLH